MIVPNNPNNEAKLGSDDEEEDMDPEEKQLGAEDEREAGEAGEAEGGDGQGEQGGEYYEGKKSEEK